MNLQFSTELPSGKANALRILLNKVHRISSSYSSYLRIVLAGLIFAISPASKAQGDLTVLQTGGVVTSQLTLDLSGISNPLIIFNFGFVSAEIPAPNTFLDAYTVTLQDSSLNTAILLTIDANVLMWAPDSPGAIPITDAQIKRVTISPPSTSPILGQGWAYSVQMPVPSQFTGSTVTAYFDLFDNLDQKMSLGWYNNVNVVSVSVPEPKSLLVGGLGLLVLLGVKKYNHRC